MRYAFLLCTIISACTTTINEDVTEIPTKADINYVLDDWHNAAAEADFDHYFGHFENDSAIFMGTDATERWTIAEFKPWAKPYFDGGSAWNFTPIDRHVYFSDNGKVSWFDEELATPNWGRAVEVVY